MNDIDQTTTAEEIITDTANIAFDVLLDVMHELCEARQHFPAMRSAHEGFAIMKEEVDELWEEVRNKSLNRTSTNLLAMRREAIQVAAMAMRLVIDICDKKAEA